MARAARHAFIATPAAAVAGTPAARSVAFVVLLLLTAAGGCKPEPTGARPATSPGSPDAAPPTLSGTVTVFAAASLTEAFGDMKLAFEARHPGVAVVYNFGGSQQLRGQIQNGAPADVFCSANTKEMDALVAGGQVSRLVVETFARNKLVVIVPKPVPGGSVGGGAAKVMALADLAKPGVKLDLAAPAVPVGAYTVKMLDAMAADPAYGPAFKTAALANVVSQEENVKSVVAKIRLGEADAGVVYATDAGPETAASLTTIEIPDPFNQVGDYPLAPLAASPKPALASAFAAFVMSADGRAALAKRGFLPPAAAKPDVPPAATQALGIDGQIRYTDVHKQFDYMPFIGVQSSGTPYRDNIFVNPPRSGFGAAGTLPADSDDSAAIFLGPDGTPVRNADGTLLRPRSPTTGPTR